MVTSRPVNIVAVLITVMIFLMSGSDVLAQENRQKIDSCLNILLHAREDSNKVNLLNYTARQYSQISNDSVGFYGERAFRLGNKLKYQRGTAEAMSNLAHYHQNRGDYANAMDAGVKVLKSYEQLNDKAKIAASLLDLAMINKDLSGLHRTEEYIDNAFSYAHRSRDMYQSIRDTGGIISTMINLGLISRDKAITSENKIYYDSAFRYYTTALNLINTTGKAQTDLPRLYNNLSQVYSEYKKDYKTALDYLLKAMEINEKRNRKLSLTYNYGNISNIYVALKDHANALKYGRAMLSASIELNRPERVQNALYQMFQVYRAVHKWDSAHDYYVMADGLNDSLTDFAKTRQVMELQTKYETEKKEAAIKLLNIDNENQNKRIAFLIAALVVFIILAVGMVWLYNRTRMQKRKITEQSNELELVMKELHHRVKNNLQVVSSLLSLQTYKLEDEAVITVLKESQMRVQAMSLIHQRLYKTNSLTNVNIKEYVTDLAETLMSAYGYQHSNFDLEINIDKEVIDVDKALPIGLIINELVTNAMKYAYHHVERPLLKIELKETEGEIVLTVKDNGPGIDEMTWKKKSGSFGKQLITALSKQLRAEHRVNISGGAVFTVVIPYKEKAA